MFSPEMIVILALLPLLACLIVAGVLCYKGREGWGWFLFVGFLLATVFETAVGKLMKMLE